MNIERKILANLAYHLHKARQLKNERNKCRGGEYEFLYHEAVAQWVGLHNAFQQSKRIYFDNLPKE